MASNNLDIVNVEVKVAGEVCYFETMELFQSICAHHRFKIKVNYKPGQPSVWAVGPDMIFQQLGAKVSIVMTHNETGEKTEFYGLISNIDVCGFDGNQGYVLLEGGSPTLLLDKDPAMACYVEQSLNTIVSDVMGKSGVAVSLTNSPKFGETLPYVARYKETSYGFLARLLRSYGEWFYYDGQKLLVGNPENATETRVAYDVDLTEVSMNASIRSLNNSVFDFDPVTNEFHYDYGGTPEGVTLGSKAAEKCSTPLYPTEAAMPSVRAVHSGQDIESYGDSEYHRNYSQLAQFTAKSRNCGIRLGELVVATVPKSLPDVTATDLGRYRVTEITHHVDSRGKYTNAFRGVPGSTPSMPWGDAAMPVAHPEMAKVIDQQDPENLGRVKVQFMWQSVDGGESYWMHVQSPDAGKSDKVAKNRGVVFIPEVGDLVMVGFEQGNPDRPFVMGSIFYKDNAQGAAKDNTLKSITTRSGHTIEFNDDEGGEWGITIKDANGCTLRLNTKDKSIEITAPETIALTAKNISLNAEEGIQLAAKKSVDVTAEEDVNLAAKGNLAQQADSDISVAAQGNVNIEAKGDANIVGNNATFEGKSQATVNGAQTMVSGKMTILQGAAHKVDLT